MNCKKIIAELLQFIECRCFSCIGPATIMVSWKECAAETPFCDKCDPYTAFKHNTVLKTRTMPQTKIIRKIQKEISNA